MSSNKTYTVAYRRKREGKTNYKKRLSLIKSGKPRLVIRKSLKSTTLQIISFDPKGDKIIAAVNSNELKKLGWDYNKANLPSAYLAGLLLAQNAKQKNISEAILDIGLQISIKGSRLYSALKGLIDNGLDIAVDEKILPVEDRITGKHIADYAEKLKCSSEKYNKQFSSYIKINLKPEDIAKKFEEIKNKITQM